VQTDALTGLVSLIAGTTITQNGNLTAGSLTGSATGLASVTGATPASNQIAGLGNFSASGFLLNDSQKLNITGVVTGGASATIADTAAVAVSGSVRAATIALTGDSLSIPGAVSDNGTGKISLIAISGGVTGSGTLVAGTLTGNSATGLSLTNASNQIGMLAGYTVSGGSFALADGKALTVSNLVQVATGQTLSFGADSFTVAASGKLIAPGGLVELGPVSFGQALSVDSSRFGPITASVIRIGQSVAVPGVKAGSIDINGNVTFAGTLDLVASGAITQSSGVLRVANLTGSSNGASFLQAGNSLPVLGIFDAGSGIFALRDQSMSGLSVTGSVIAAGIQLRTDAGLVLTGVLNAGAGIVDLSSAGITQTAGQVIAGSLNTSFGVGGSVSLTQTANHISNLGPFATTTGFTLVNGRSLSVSGTITDATSVKLDSTGYALTIAPGGSVTAPAVSLTADSVSIAGSLSGGVVSLTSGSGINASGGISARTVVAADQTSFNETGATINATTIRVTAPAIALNGGSFLTGATSVPGGLVSVGKIPDGSGPGLFLSADSVSQTGTTRINADGIAGTIRVGSRVSGGAVAASLDKFQAPSSQLYLVLGSGSASGSVVVQGLEVAYSQSGSANLTGSVNGQLSQAAASASFITPAINSSYKMNGCVIASATCSIGTFVTPILPVAPITSITSITSIIPEMPDPPDRRITPALSMVILPPAVFLLTDTGILQFFSSSSSSFGPSSRNASFTVFPVMDFELGNSSGNDANPDEVLPDIANRDF